MNASDAGARGHTATKLMEQDMERKPQSRYRRQIREECADGQVSSWPQGLRVMRQRRSIEAGERAAVAALEDIGTGAEESVLLSRAALPYEGTENPGSCESLGHLEFCGQSQTPPREAGAPLQARASRYQKEFIHRQLPGHFQPVSSPARITSLVCANC